jgi:amino-acid N-acetyltransferase
LYQLIGVHQSEMTPMFRTLTVCDYNDIERLLIAEGLPSDDIRHVKWQQLLGAYRDERLVAIAGLEAVEPCYLLRSVVCCVDYRKQKLASSLITLIHQHAQDQMIRRIYLLTMAAELWFKEKFGYRTIDRADAPQAIIASEQFSRLCPSSAKLMCLDLGSITIPPHK